MADLTITAADVAADSDALTKRGTAAAALTQGQSIYIDASNTIALADADALATAACTGVTLNAAAAGQPVDYIQEGGLDIGATLTVGEIYVVSTTAGGVAPYGDLGIGDFTTIIGIATAADKLQVKLCVGGVAKA